MSPHRRTRRRALPALLAVSALLWLPPLGGCTGSIFKTRLKTPAVYQLQLDSAPASAAAGPAPAPVAPVAPAAAAAPGIELAVLKPRVRIGLDNDLVAVLYPDLRLEHLAAARWSGPLDEVLQDLELEAFRAQSSAIGFHADASAFGSGYWLELDVEDFQAEYGTGGAPVVHVRAEGRLGSASDRRILGRFELEAREPAAADRVGAIVEAYNRAVQRVLGELVTRSLAALAPPAG
jgi:cholesterol transport system auxiliary component